MIRFDPTKVSFEIVRLKSVSLALGGSISVIDEKHSIGKKEVQRRVEVPLAVARDFIMKHKKVAKYLKPVYTAIIRYDTLVIAMERHPLSIMGELEAESVDGTIRRWEPASKINYETLINALDLTDVKKWYFDGRYLYTFRNDDIEQVIAEGDLMTANGQFRKVAVQSFDMLDLDNKVNLVLAERSCLSFVSTNGDIVISPPIWKKLEDVGGTQLGKAGVIADEDDGVVLSTFDSIDDHLAVNLNFALKAGMEIGKAFGYEYVEPLQLPRLMIELCTVNLPNVAKEIKGSFPIGMKFTHAIAWLLGMLRRADTLETTLIIRSLLKYLTKRGIFRNNMFTAARVFHNGKTIDDVKPICVEDELKQEPLQVALARMIQSIHR